jgi:hypothetical protein
MVVQQEQENVVLYNIEAIVVEEAGDNAIYSIAKMRPTTGTDRFKPVEFFNDEHENRWVKFWPKNGPAKGKQASIPIERLVMVVHSK